MKIAVKELNGVTWEPIQLEKVIGQSLINFIVNHPNPVVAALYDQSDTPTAFVSNQQEYVERYAEKGASFFAADLQQLMGTDVLPSVYAFTFPGSTLAEIKFDSALPLL